MPIDIDRFESESADALGGGRSQPERVLSFLVQNADKAFRPVEISDATDVPENSINAVLKRLADRGLVRHKGTYWAVTADTERLRDLTHYRLVTESMNDLYGVEDPNEWLAETSEDSRNSEESA